MCSPVFFRNSFKRSQELLPSLNRIFGLHHESETVECVIISGPFAFRDHLTQACG